MNLLQAFKMAFKSISMKKGRSFLTMLGIIIGVASVVIMVSVITGQNKKQMEYWEKQGNNKIEVSAMRWNMDVSQELYNYCLSLNNLIDGVSPKVQIGNTMTIRYGTNSMSTQGNDWSKNLSVVLGNDKYSLCNSYVLKKGRDLSYLDVEKTNNVCVLGGKTAKTLFNFVDPVGKTVTINNTPFLVIGVYETKAVENWPEWDNMVLLPYTFNRTLNNNQPIDTYVVKAKTTSATTEAVTRLKGFLSGLIGKQNGYYNVQNNDQYKSEMNAQLAMQAAVLGGIAGISLLVGGIGIMNIMLVTVTERTREIGIRKAIGAERKSIIAQFLIEAAVICSIGGMIGILLGYLGTLIAGKLLLKMILLPNTWITVGAFLFSVALGIIFGMYPAIKASGLQPVEALRAD